MIFHKNHLLADDSHEICLIFFRKLGKMSQNLSSAAVVIGALRVKKPLHSHFRSSWENRDNYSSLATTSYVAQMPADIKKSDHIKQYFYTYQLGDSLV